MRYGFVVPFATAREFSELAGLGEGNGYEGTHYSVQSTEHMVPDPPVQRPRPPVWVVGARVSGRSGQPSLERAARWDGLLPTVIDDGGAGGLRNPAQLAALAGEVKALRASAGLDAEAYDVIIEADSSGEFIKLQPPDPASWEEAGATWWIESWWSIERVVGDSPKSGGGSRPARHPPAESRSAWEAPLHGTLPQ